MFVECVVQTYEERPAARQRIVCRQIDERITTHTNGVRRVVESLGRSDDFGAQPQPLPGLRDRNRAVTPRAARKQIARCIVLGVLQISAGSDAQAAPCAEEFDRNALQRRVLDVLRRTSGCAAFEHDQIADTVVVCDDSHGEVASRIAQRGFQVVRRLRLEAGIRKPGVVEVVERRGLESGAITRAGAPAVADPVAVGKRAGRLAAELRAFIAAQVCLQRLRPVLPLPDAGDGIGIARGDRESSVGVDPFLTTLERER